MFNFIFKNKYVLKHIIYLPIEILRILKLKSQIKGKKVFILGSAPNPNLDLYSDEHILISVNGSAANAKALGLRDPIITVIDFELINKKTAIDKDVRSIIVKNKLLEDINLGFVISTQSNDTLLNDPNILNAKIKKFYSIHRFTRKILIYNVTKNKKLDDNDSLVSTGAFACALCFFLGANEVIISGFSFLKNENFHPPSFYKTDESQFQNKINPEPNSKIDTRSHSLADSNLISSLVINGRKIKTNEREILPLIQNWGNDS